MFLPLEHDLSINLFLLILIPLHDQDHIIIHMEIRIVMLVGIVDGYENFNPSFRKSTKNAKVPARPFSMSVWCFGSLKTKRSLLNTFFSYNRKNPCRLSCQAAPLRSAFSVNRIQAFFRPSACTSPHGSYRPDQYQSGPTS